MRWRMRHQNTRSSCQRTFWHSQPERPPFGPTAAKRSTGEQAAGRLRQGHAATQQQDFAGVEIPENQGNRNLNDWAKEVESRGHYAAQPCFLASVGSLANPAQVAGHRLDQGYTTLRVADLRSSARRPDVLRRSAVISEGNAASRGATRRSPKRRSSGMNST
jgi:hypothetical protein